MDMLRLRSQQDRVWRSKSRDQEKVLLLRHTESMSAVASGSSCGREEVPEVCSGGSSHRKSSVAGRGMADSGVAGCRERRQTLELVKRWRIKTCEYIRGNGSNGRAGVEFGGFR